jgi:hypothetical protein
LFLKRLGVWKLGQALQIQTDAPKDERTLGRLILDLLQPIA